MQAARQQLLEPRAGALQPLFALALSLILQPLPDWQACQAGLVQLCLPAAGQGSSAAAQGAQPAAVSSTQPTQQEPCLASAAQTPAGVSAALSDQARTYAVELVVHRV